MQNIAAEDFTDFLFRGMGGGGGVLNNVMEKPGGDAHRIEFHVSQNAGHFQRVGEIRLAGEAHLAIVDPGREDIGPVDDIHIRIRVVFGYLIEDVGDSNHGQ